MSMVFGSDPTVFQMCVLGLPSRVENPIWNVRLSRILRLLDPFATQSNKSNTIMINLDVWLKFYHDWLELDAYIEWLIN